MSLPYKKIYFVGIKGVGMAALAVIAKQAGFKVGGSDVADEFITDRLLKDNAIAIDPGFTTETLQKFIGEERKQTLVIVTAAHDGLNNPQAQYAQNNHVDTLTFGQALGMFQYGTLVSRQDIMGISVAGSHGKTTTTAMLATSLMHMEQDPSYLIGTSDVGSLGDPGHFGTGKYFIVESDEYVSDVQHDPVPKFHYQHPHAAIITNVDFDHPDVFESIDSVYEAFKTFIHNIQQGGILVYSGDDSSMSNVLTEKRDDVQYISYGLSPESEYCAYEMHTTVEGIKYNVRHGETELGEIQLNVIGEHNVKNSLAVVALLHTLGFSFEKIAIGLASFSGTKRRLELRGNGAAGQVIIDDYAHHPAEIQATLTALAQAYPDKKLVCIFQPHTYSRTKALVDEFAQALMVADSVILLPIFTSAREGVMTEAQQNELYDQIVAKTHAKFIESKENVVEYCTQNFSSDEYILVTMGAGDVYKIGDRLLQ